jgi:hypothetical protein
MAAFGKRLQAKTARLRRPPAPPRSVRKRMQRMALVRHAMVGEQARDKAAITLPKLKFLDGES